MAAAIHLGYLPSRVKSEAELRFFLKQTLPSKKGRAAQEIGVLFLMGRGPKGEEVYTLATGNKPALLLKTITNMLPFFGEDPTNYRIIDCNAYIIGIGRKKLGGKEPGRLCSWYNTIGRMVEEVQRDL